MAVGGSGGSTSGGVKFSRMGIIMKSIVATIKEALAPDSARVVVSYNHVGRRILSPEVVKEAMTVFVLYVATYAVGALVGIAHGYEAPQAIFESVAMASNGGVSSGLAAPGMSPSLELVLHRADVGRPSGIRHAAGSGGGDYRVAQSAKGGCFEVDAGGEPVNALPLADCVRCGCRRGAGRAACGGVCAAGCRACR